MARMHVVHRLAPPRLACAAALCLLALPLAAQAQDSAYVDGPAGRSQRDPARADGGSVAPGTVFVRPGTAGSNPAMDMQMQMLGLSMANLRRQQEQEAAGLSPDGTSGILGPGAPGNGGASPDQGRGAASPDSPMRQIGAGLMQDAGNAMDAGIQRSIYGSNAVIMVPSVAPPSGGGGW